MFSDIIKSALENEVVGQSRAVNNVVRGATLVLSGLTPHERSYCAYLLMGPTGTGKSHLVQALTRLLRVDRRRVIVLDCAPGGHDPKLSLAHQLAPLVASRPEQPPTQTPTAAPLSIILGERLEQGSPEFYKALARMLESGHVALPEGSQAMLSNALVFFTSTMCSDEILEEPARIGFTGPFEDDDEGGDQDRVSAHCRDAAEKHFGSDLLGHLDGLLIFRRLEESHLEAILERRLARVNEWLRPRGFRCRMNPAAREFLLEKGARHLRLGARDLVTAHTKFVEFPVADLMISGRLPPGGVVEVDRKPEADQLHFTVHLASSREASEREEVASEIPIASS